MASFTPVETDDLTDLYAIEALAAVLRDERDVQLDVPDDVYRRLERTGIRRSTIGKCWGAVRVRAEHMRAVADREGKEI